jgi:hypothetical protein
VIPYEGLPITPETAAVVAIARGHAFVPFSDYRQLPLAISVCQSFALDNGAFSAWRKGKPITDWKPFYDWAAECRRIPSCDFAVVPDVIDGDEEQNDALLAAWPLGKNFGAPVWHLHESLGRLQRLVREWPRVCFGSSGEFAKLKTPAWWQRMAQAMQVACDEDGYPLCKFHGLRMLDGAISSRFPFASVDSTNIGQNIGKDVNWANGVYLPSTKEGRAAVMRERIENPANNSPPRWDFSVVIPDEPEPEPQLQLEYA